jgi:hypothetical protein
MQTASGCLYQGMPKLFFRRESQRSRLRIFLRLLPLLLSQLSQLLPPSPLLYFDDHCDWYFPYKCCGCDCRYKCCHSFYCFECICLCPCCCCCCECYCECCYTLCCSEAQSTSLILPQIDQFNGVVRWRLKSRILAFWDMLKVSMLIVIRTIDMSLRVHYNQHSLFRAPFVIHLETNYYSPRQSRVFVPMANSRSLVHHTKVLGRALVTITPKFPFPQ